LSYDWQLSLREVDDAQLRAALTQANIPALLACMLHHTGSSDQFDRVQPVCELFAEEVDGLTEAQREEARELAIAAFAAFRNGGELPEPPEDAIVAAMHRITGADIPDFQMPMLREELNLFGEDARRVEIDTGDMPEDFRVLIIGSGMSGILTAIRLKQEGIPFTLLEKNAEIGGTWYENTYPGCQVDSANHLYNYIFEQNTQWPNHFSGHRDLFKYFNSLVEKYGLREHVRLGCSVTEARFDEASGHWTVSVDDNGVTAELTANVVISAVGQLNIPKFPDIEGVGRFDGTCFHSARWEHEHDLAGKRVAVIGTGCSAVQFVPEIAGECGELKIFQRSPPWLLPVEEYHQPMSEEELWLLRELPFYARWYRFFLFRTKAVDGELPLLYSEPGWNGPQNTVSEGNQMLRDALIESLEEQVAALQQAAAVEEAQGEGWLAMAHSGLALGLRFVILLTLPLLVLAGILAVALRHMSSVRNHRIHAFVVKVFESVGWVYTLTLVGVPIGLPLIFLAQGMLLNQQVQEALVEVPGADA